MTASPIELVSRWLQNLADPDVINDLVASDATYVSLNTENPELKKIEPWAGTSVGPQAFLDNLSGIFSRWDVEAFNVATVFGSDEDVAVFGDFRYKSKSLAKVVASPLAIWVRVVDGQVIPEGAALVKAALLEEEHVLSWRGMHLGLIATARRHRDGVKAGEAAGGEP